VRSTAQNALYWALLTEVSERLKVDGKSIDSDAWHEWFKKRFLGADEIRLPNGEIMIRIRRTADLPEDAFSDYLSRVEEWSRDRNVWLPEREI
jgi:hypothetical protein